MSINKKVIGIFFLLLGSFVSFSQSLHTLREKVVSVNPELKIIKLDSIPLVFGTVQISYQDTITSTYKTLIEGIDFMCRYELSEIELLHEIVEKQLTIKYRILNPLLFKPQFKKSTSGIMPDIPSGNKEIFFYEPNKNTLNEKDESQIQKNGLISRGVSVGNTQDLVLNSLFNLQLSGKLNNQWNVAATISDDNSLIQPDGNTQQLQEFDRVFIRLFNENQNLIVGDFEVRQQPSSYFISYFKRNRGINYNIKQTLKNKAVLQFNAGSAIARGRFARNLLTVIEGNQGPYRLTGSNGEQFVLVNAGTERVYLDGKPLLRGMENDYIIDYNTGELFFMPKIVITNVSRVIVEFQYSDRNFTRTVSTGGIDYAKGRWSLQLNAYNEQDNRNQPILQQIEDKEKLFLKTIGDNLAAAITQKETLVKTFTSEKILYRKVDTLNGIGVYVYCPQATTDTQYYEVSFSFTGERSGNYVQQITPANGRVYRYVEPIAGEPQGNYEPFILLITPKKLLNLSAGLGFQISKFTSIRTELAMSSFDKNQYSQLDNSDNIGIASHTEYNHLSSLRKKNGNWKIESSGMLDYLGKNFKPAERFRSVEFDRTWNRQLNNATPVDSGNSELNALISAGIKNKDKFSLSGRTSYYNKENFQNGMQYGGQLRLNQNGHQLVAETDWVLTSLYQPILASPDLKNKISGNKILYTKQIEWFSTGTSFQNEKSAFSNSNNDTLQNNSFAYQLFNAFVDANTNGNIFRINYQKRLDQLAKFENFSNASNAEIIGATADFFHHQQNHFTLSSTFRKLEIIDSSLTSQKPERTLLNRLEYEWYLLKNTISGNTFLQSGNGQEQQREYSYLEVQAGRGFYAWRDYNLNGVKEINEFETAYNIDEAKYIRIFNPTNNFIRTNFSEFNQSVSLNPSNAWRGENGLKGFLARFSNNAAYRIEKKTAKGLFLLMDNPLVAESTDSNLLTLNSYLNNNLYFNRSNPILGVDYIFQNQKSKILLVNGFDTRTRNEHNVNIRSNPWKFLLINFVFRLGEKSFVSEFFTTRNYHFQYLNLEPKLTFQAFEGIRIATGYKYIKSDSYRVDSGPKSEINQGIVELRYTGWKNGFAEARILYSQVYYTGLSNSAVAYEMLQGMANGNNWNWNLQLQKRLNTNMILNISYEARKPGDVPIIHIGRMELRYLF